MNRVLRTAFISAAVLLSATVAFSVAASITPPGAEHVRAVVTNRPVIVVAAASGSVPVRRPSTASTPTPDVPAAKPFAATAPRSSQPAAPRAVPGKRPPVVATPTAKPKPPVTSVEPDSDHEVVTPPVRDEDDGDDDDDDADEKDSSAAPSTDTIARTSAGESGFSGKGD